MTAHIEKLYCYPVKGLSPESRERVTVATGKCFPNDRRFAIAHGSTEFLSGPTWMSKNHFLMLAKNAKLAQLRSRFDDETGLLTLERNGKKVTQGQITDLTGRMLIEQFLASFLIDESRGTPKLVEARETPFTDIPNQYISLINLASVRDLERVVRTEVDPLRFRGNVYLGGLSPWAENDWIGRRLKLGDVEVEIKEAIGRCAATSVNLETAERDLNIPRSLQQGFGHRNMGVYAEVLTDGVLEENATVTLLS